MTNIIFHNDKKEAPQSVTATCKISVSDGMSLSNLSLTGWGKDEAEAEQNLRANLKELLRLVKNLEA